MAIIACHIRIDVSKNEFIFNIFTHRGVVPSTAEYHAEAGTTGNGWRYGVNTFRQPLMDPNTTVLGTTVADEKRI